MHTPLLIGILSSLSITAVCLSVFFLQAWWQRPQEREFLYFGLLGTSVALHTSLQVLVYTCAVGGPQPLPLAVLLTLGVIPTKLASVLLLHFSLHYSKVKRGAQLAAPVYVLMGAFVALALSGGWWKEVPEEFELVRVWGFEVHTLALLPSQAASPYYLVVVLIVLTTVVLLGRTWWHNRATQGALGIGDRGGVAAFFGSLLLAAATFNDIALVTGWYTTVPLASAGFLLLAFGLCLTVVTRYGALSNQLERSGIELSRRSNELRASYQQLSHTQDALVRNEQLAVVGELAAVIANEVRNPLAIVNNAVASLRKRRTTEADRKTLLEIINEEMERLDNLVHRLLNYARPVVPKRTEVPLRPLLELTATVLEERARLQFEYVFEHPDVFVIGDADLLRHAFENIINNAAQAMRHDGTIRIYVGPRRVGQVDVIAVDFEDRGEGMSDESCAQALSPFFTTRPTGTGLGLPIVRRIIEAHHGSIEISSRLGHGTTVSVLVPQSREATLPLRHDRSGRISLLP